MLKNLTPHVLNIFSEDLKKQVKTLQPEGIVARVRANYQATGEIEGVPLFSVTYGEVTDLPDPEVGAMFVVSAMVKDAMPNRRDLLSPGELVRNDQGQPVGCRGLRR